MSHGRVADAEVGTDEAQLALALLGGMTDDTPDLSQYRDTYAEKLQALIDAKVEGKELVTPPAEELQSVINLMDALKASMQQIKAPATPPRKMAASAKQPTKAAKQKKRTG